MTAERWDEADLIKMMDDTSGYFPAGDWVDMRPHLLVLYTLARYSTCPPLPPNIGTAPLCLEIGVRQGVSTIALLMAMRRTGGTLISLDVDPVETAVAQRIIAEQKLDRYWQFHLTSSNEFAPPSEIDFLWIDGDHRAPQPQRDVVRFAPSLRVGGILALHDYFAPPGGDHGVSLAVERVIKDSGAFEVCTLPWAYGLTICRKIADVERERGTVEVGSAQGAPVAPVIGVPAPEPYRW